MPFWISRIPSLKCSLKFQIFQRISVASFSTSSTPKIAIFDYLVTHHNFSPECASNVSSSSSTMFLKKPQNADSILNFLKETGFSKDHIEAFVRKGPWLLYVDLETTTIKPKIKVFQDLRFHSSDFAYINSASPSILHRKADSLRQSILGLKNVLEPNADICRLLKKSGCGRILGYDLNRTLVPNIEYLKSCGVCPLQIASYVCRFPLFLINKPARLKDIVERVDEMGVDRKSKMFIEAVRVMISFSIENWELKLDVFRELDFSEQNILKTFRVYPRAFTVSGKRLRR